jgi:hypothetical protein
MDVTYSPDLFQSELAEVEWPDFVMSRTIKDAKNVFLAFHHPDPDVERSDDFREVVDLLLADQPVAAERRAAEVSARLRRKIEDTKVFNAQQPWLRARMVAAIQRQPELEKEQVLEQLNVQDPGTAAVCRGALREGAAGGLPANRRSRTEWQSQARSGAACVDLRGDLSESQQP